MLLTPESVRAEGIGKRFGGLAAVSDLDFELVKGEILAIIGPNGAGKTTLLNMISGLLRPSAGRIMLNGRDITGLPPQERCHLGIGRAFQVVQPFPEMTVAENIQSGADYLPEARRQAQSTRKMVLELFPRLAERSSQLAGTLSGGELQMLAIARALMSRPKLLLLDEPSLGLAPLIVKQIFEVVRDLNRNEGLTVFLVEQNAYHALKLAHRGYVMVNGNITMSGTGAELLKREEVRAAYLEGGRH